MYNMAEGDRLLELFTTDLCCSVTAMHLLIEPFNSGSHKQLIDLLLKHIPDTHAITLPGKKWHWKARTSALYLSQVIPRNDNYTSIFASSVLNLAELIALRPDLAPLHKVLYFHENQLVYPTKRSSDRDFQYGYNQILSSLVADVVLFNSSYNMESFLANINSFLKLIPYERPRNVPEQLRHKCHVLNFPMEFPDLKSEKPSCHPSSNTEPSDTSEIIEGITFNSPEKVHVSNRDSKSNSEEISKFVESNNENARLQEVKGDENRALDETCDTYSIHNINSDINHESRQIAKTLDDDIGKGESYKELVTKRKHKLDTCRDLDQADSTADQCSNYQAVHTVQKECNQPSSAVCCENKTDLHEDCTGLQESYQMIGMKRQKITVQEENDMQKKSENIEKDYLSPLHIVWPHRWEHDKGPESFFNVLFKLQESGVKFKLSVLGENFSEIPEIFEMAKIRLHDVIEHWGYQPTKEDYYNVLRQADCVVSTANHEFFGVAMLEAVHLGCYPLCPNRLVYPEIFPKQCLYNTDQQLFKKLREFCRRPDCLRKNQCQIDTKKYEWESLRDDYIKYITKSNTDLKHQPVVDSQMKGKR